MLTTESPPQLHDFNFHAVMNPFSGEQQVAHKQATQKAWEDWYQKYIVGESDEIDGYEDFEYDLHPLAREKADGLATGFRDVAGLVMGGSRSAAEHLTRGYTDSFRQRAGGIVGDFAEGGRRLGAEGFAQGLSPDVARNMLMEKRSSVARDVGMARADTGMRLSSELASLAKGTGSELAGVKRDEMATLLDYIIAEKGVDASRHAAELGLIGDIAGGILESVPSMGGG